MGNYYREFHRNQKLEELRREQARMAQFRPDRRNWNRGRRETEVRKPVTPVPTNIYRLNIQITEKDLDTLRQYHWNGWGGGQQQVRPKIAATVLEGDTVYDKVSMNLKGSAGSFRSIDDKPALTLRFSKHQKDQRFHGYSKLSLNNSVQDPSYLTEIICRELFEKAGIPVPRAEHATVLINGTDKNLYVLAEGFDKQFLRRHFNNLSGNLYDGGFCQDIDMPLDANSGDHPEDRSDLHRLLEASVEPDPAKRWKQLNDLLDMDRFITFVAMEVMTCHWDGYSINRNNYRLFHDMETDKFVFIPHGMDQMFGVSRSHPESDILPRQVRGVVTQGVLSVPEGLMKYFNRVAELRRTVWDETALTNRVKELAARIRPVLEAYGPDIAQEHDFEVSQLIRRISLRSRSITEQLAWYESQMKQAQAEHKDAKSETP